MDQPADLETLLLWLGQATDTGAQQYIEMRQRLVALFEYWGCEDAENLADVTMDRTARAIVKPGFVCTTSRFAYLRGVAHNVSLESKRKNRTVSQEALPELADTVSATRPGNRGVETLHNCLERCLARLPPDRRSLLLRYYQGDKSAKIDGRAQLAQQEGMTLNTLRLKIFRLRGIVRRCVKACTKNSEIDM